MEYISADGYMRLENRGRNLEVEPELVKIVSALPTQIKPEDRTALLRAILGDLSCKAVWRRWTQERELGFTALTAADVQSTLWRSRRLKCWDGTRSGPRC